MTNEVFDRRFFIYLLFILYFVQSQIGCDLKLNGFVDTLRRNLSSLCSSLCLWNHQFFPQNFQLTWDVFSRGLFVICTFSECACSIKDQSKTKKTIWSCLFFKLLCHDFISLAHLGIDFPPCGPWARMSLTAPYRRQNHGDCRLHSAN